MENTFIAKIPAWALCYLINGDMDLLSDAEIASIDAWMAQNGNPVVCCPDSEDSPYFTAYPDMGREFGATNVYDCICMNI